MRNLIADVTIREAWNLNGGYDRAYLFVFPAIAVWNFVHGEVAWGLMGLLLMWWQIHDLFLQAAVIKLKNEAEQSRETGPQPNITMFKDGTSIADVDAALARQRIRENLRYTDGR